MLSTTLRQMATARVLALVSLALLASLASPFGSVARAQRADSARAAARRAVAQDSTRTHNRVIAPPLSPRRAFLTSFLLPGSAQSILGRNKAAVLFLAFEGAAISMIHESSADVREARRGLGDSVIVAFPETAGGTPTTIPGRFTDALVRTRKSHVEDWIAVLVANHLFAGADAYVASHLWDVPIELAVKATGQGTAVVASLHWR
ncbi:MAG: hypothetical protein JWO05_545 [Gemmatimonadetes bacterium]|nr:hypothetical protein [Gemmatimonadota bacterium]